MSTYPLVVHVEQLSGSFMIRTNPDSSLTLLLRANVAITPELVELINDVAVHRAAMAQHVQPAQDQPPGVQRLAPTGSGSATPAAAKSILLRRLATDACQDGRRVLVVGQTTALMYLTLELLQPPAPSRQIDGPGERRPVGPPPVIEPEIDISKPAPVSKDRPRPRRRTRPVIVAHSPSRKLKPRKRSRIAALAPAALLSVAVWLAGSLWVDVSYDIDHADGRFGMAVEASRTTAFLTTCDSTGPTHEVAAGS